MEHMAAPRANLSHTSATMSIVLLGHSVGHPRGQAASFFGSLAPKSGVVNEHGTRVVNEHGTYSSRHTPNSGGAMWFLFQIAIMTWLERRVSLGAQGRPLCRGVSRRFRGQ